MLVGQGQAQQKPQEDYKKVLDSVFTKSCEPEFESEWLAWLHRMREWSSPPGSPSSEPRACTNSLVNRNF